MQEKRLSLFPTMVANAVKKYKLDALLLQEVWYQQAYQEARKSLQKEGFSMPEMGAVNEEECVPPFNKTMPSDYNPFDSDKPWCSGEGDYNFPDPHYLEVISFKCRAWAGDRPSAGFVLLRDLRGVRESRVPGQEGVRPRGGPPAADQGQGPHHRHTHDRQLRLQMHGRQR